MPDIFTVIMDDSVPSRANLFLVLVLFKPISKPISITRCCWLPSNERTVAENVPSTCVCSRLRASMLPIRAGSRKLHFVCLRLVHNVTYKACRTAWLALPFQREKYTVWRTACELVELRVSHGQCVRLERL